MLIYHQLQNISNNYDRQKKALIWQHMGVRIIVIWTEAWPT